jgi:ribosomal protein S27AE
MPFTPQQVTEALAARQVSTQCPRCSTPDAFEVLAGFVYAEVRGGQNIRNAGLQCRRCGFLSLHSLDVLGLES